MTLRKKTLLIIGVTLVGLIEVLYATSSNVLLGSFARMEDRNTSQNVERVLDALSGDLSTLSSKAGDWANWDDTYAFIEDANSDYIKTNLTDTTFVELGLNLMLFIHSSGRIVFGMAFDLQNEQEMPVPQSLQEYVSTHDVLLRHPSTQSSTTGIVLLPEGSMLVASRPILTSQGEGPIRGTLIFGRYLDSAEVERLAGITHLTLTVRRFDDPQVPADFQAVRASWTTTEGSLVQSEDVGAAFSDRPILVRPLSEQTVAGYALLRDIYGQPVLVLRAGIPRAIYQQGQASMRYSLVSLLAVGLVFGVVSLLLIEKLVLSPVARLNTSVSSIGANGDLSARVAMAGRDELASLAGEINGMLEALERGVTERKRTGEALVRRAREMAALYETSLEINSQREVSTLLHAIVQRAAGLLGARMGGLYLMGADGETLELVVSHNLPGDYVGTTLRLGEGLSGRVAQTGNPLMVDDYLHWEGRAAAYAESPFRRILGVPLKLGEKVIGVINITDDEKPGEFAEDEVRLVSLFADQAALAIENARLYAAEQTRRQELAALYELSRQLVATDEMEAVLDSIARHAVETVHVTFCRVLILQDGVLVCRGAYPVRLLECDLGVGQPEPALSWPHYQRALAQVDPLVLHLDDPALSDEERQSLFLDLVQSLCLVSLQAGDQAFGVLALGEARNPAREPFDADKLRLTAAIADQAAGAIHRARLHAELEAAYIETVLALANTVDARDTYTGDHSQRLAVWAEATARELGCSEEEIQAIRWAALLHDIGKIGVPDHILRKPGALAETEWVVMKRHPEIGAQIVAPVKKLANVAPIIRAHQEYWDGTGYPDGLQGESIPLGARILAVVDAYGAITDERVYRKARSHTEAVAELRYCVGTQFDPQVVEAFLRVVNVRGAK